MAEKNQDKKAVDKNDKIEQHKKSTTVSRAKSKVASSKNVNKTATEDRNDPTGNAHLAD